MLKHINLKEGNPTVDYSLAVVEIAIENAKSEGVNCIKVLHGYGSHGRGGVILIELRKFLQSLKRKKVIRDYFGGDRWNYFDESVKNILSEDKSIECDEDLGRSNPGITIIWI